jgi:hypothetical protein
MEDSCNSFSQKKPLAQAVEENKQASGTGFLSFGKKNSFMSKNKGGFNDANVDGNSFSNAFRK